MLKACYQRVADAPPTYKLMVQHDGPHWKTSPYVALHIFQVHGDVAVQCGLLSTLPKWSEEVYWAINDVFDELGVGLVLREHVTPEGSRWKPNKVRPRRSTEPLELVREIIPAAELSRARFRAPMSMSIWSIEQMRELQVEYEKDGL